MYKVAEAISPFIYKPDYKVVIDNSDAVEKCSSGNITNAIKDNEVKGAHLKVMNVLFQHKYLSRKLLELHFKSGVVREESGETITIKKILSDLCKVGAVRRFYFTSNIYMKLPVPYSNPYLLNPEASVEGDEKTQTEPEEIINDKDEIHDIGERRTINFYMLSSGGIMHSIKTSYITRYPNPKEVSAKYEIEDPSLILKRLALNQFIFKSRSMNPALTFEFDNAVSNSSEEKLSEAVVTKQDSNVLIMVFSTRMERDWDKKLSARVHAYIKEFNEKYSGKCPSILFICEHEAHASKIDEFMKKLNTNADLLYTTDSRVYSDFMANTIIRYVPNGAYMNIEVHPSPLFLV